MALRRCSPSLFLMMTRKLIIAVFLAMPAWPVLTSRCHAQNSYSDIPVLKRYVGRDWIYFASASDGALIFENRPGGASNVWIAAEKSPINRRILAKTGSWTDSRGRLHTVNILKFQLESNEFGREEERLWGPSFTGGIGGIYETGVLDSRTLAVPWAKLAARVGRISRRLDDEDEEVKRLENVNAGAAVIKKNFASYLREKERTATTLLDELNRAVNAVPQMSPGEEVLASNPGSVELTGLDGLEIPRATRYDLKLVGEGSGLIRLVAVDDRFEPERFDSKIVDPRLMTPGIVAEIQEKEAAAEKAVIFAESLCRDLLTPPCP